jgi:hypothetical protein
MMDIKVLGTTDLADYQAASHLRELFASSIPKHVSGEISIFPSFKCFGQTTRDIDLVVFGLFSSGFNRKIKSKGKTNKETQQNRVDRDVSIKSFCCCIEIKDHPPSDISFSLGSGVSVRYGEKRHSATEQSENQRYSLINCLKDISGWSPYVSNLIWLRNFPKQDLKKQYQSLEGLHNCLPDQFGIDWFLHLICTQTIPYSYSGKSPYILSCMKPQQEKSVSENLRKAYEALSVNRANMGELTRRSLEKITQKTLLKNQQYVSAIGQKLVVIKGRAGTGKTIKLLHIAHDLCVYRNKRCLILTYNKALVSDIRRTLALAEITSDVARATIDVKTIHSFLYQIMDGLGILDELEEKTFLDNYERLKNALLEYLKEGAINNTDLQSLMKRKKHEIAWDTILIDESQDWPNNERDILFKLFKSNSFVIADGVDQLIREHTHTDWLSEVNYHKPIVSEKKSLRQKANLCRFCSSFAKESGLRWDITPQVDLSGGRVLMIDGLYTNSLHSRLLKNCADSGNGNYEFLFLAPPSLVVKTPKRRFIWYEEWAQLGISLWDGTSADIRSEFPTDPQQHRILQYDSCRGLEGWIVVCLHLDSFFEYKKKSFAPDLESEIALYSSDEMKLKFAYQWLMMPFTRAIDTLVISFKNPDSDIAKMIRKIGRERGDFVEFIES